MHLGTEIHWFLLGFLVFGPMTVILFWGIPEWWRDHYR